MVVALTQAYPSAPAATADEPIRSGWPLGLGLALGAAALVVAVYAACIRGAQPDPREAWEEEQGRARRGGEGGGR